MKRLITAAQESVRGTKRTWALGVPMSAVRGRTDMPRRGGTSGLDRGCV